MAFKECGLGFLADSMASRNGASARFVKAPMSASNSKDEQDESHEGRVVESLSQIAVENKWCLFVPVGSFPPPRAKHAALSIGRRMFVLGGASADGILDDVQVFHAERGVWLQLGCGSVPSLYSPSRSIPIDARGPRCVGHCMAFWETKLLVIGGRIEPKSKNLRAFALDLESQSWSILAPQGEVPVARTGQTIVQVGSSLILFGGEDGKGQMLNDVYILDLKTLIWRPLKTSGTKPSPRRGHAAACYAERYMLVYGGKSHNNYYNDTYLLDLQNMEWAKEKTKSMVPSPRAGHAGVLVGSKWYIVGGEFRGSEVLDTLAFDIESGTWLGITSVQPGTPLANDGISMVKIRNKGRTFLVVFGGHGAILSNQIFVMMVAGGSKTTTSPGIWKRDEKDVEDLSISSLPFSFTNGSTLGANPIPAEEIEESAQSESSGEENLLQGMPRSEVDEELKRAMEDKKDLERRLEEALRIIDELKREVAERSSNFTSDSENANANKAADDSKDNDSNDLREQLRESQQQIVFSVRKQALAERKLLGALRENRELRKKLLQAVKD